MESDPSTSPPLGIMLIGIFWVVIGAMIISQTASLFSGQIITSIIGLILVFIGTGLILVGWGLFIHRRWAFLTALILSFLGLIPFFLLTISFIIYLIGSYTYYLDLLTNLYMVSELLIFLVFLWMSWYLLKKIKLFTKEQ
jgi:hypothetical protein